MKTKFDSVVKFKKRAVEKIENDIKKINIAILDLKNKIDELNSSLISFSFPKTGTFSQFTYIKANQDLVRQEINSLNSQIDMLNARKKDLLEELKKAKIEYEKMKYLQGEEIKKKVKEIRLKEMRDLDEIAILLRKNDEPK
ncbi:hypothetical protein JCM11957_12330 [Caminibacter profundus]